MVQHPCWEQQRAIISPGSEWTRGTSDHWIPEIVDVLLDGPMASSRGMQIQPMHNLSGGGESCKKSTPVSLSFLLQISHQYLPLTETAWTAGTEDLMDAHHTQTWTQIRVEKYGE